MRQWWHDLNEGLQEGTPFIVFSTWLILSVLVLKILFTGGVK